MKFSLNKMRIIFVCRIFYAFNLSISIIFYMFIVYPSTDSAHVSPASTGAASNHRCPTTRPTCCWNMQHLAFFCCNMQHLAFSFCCNMQHLVFSFCSHLEVVPWSLLGSGRLVCRTQCQGSLVPCRWGRRLAASPATTTCLLYLRDVTWYWQGFRRQTGLDTL